MNKTESDKLVHYYQSELSYLRNSGMEFAKEHPKIAEKLDISESVSSDPQVERMLESFAFMTGKLQKQIDDQFPEIAHALLSILYEPLTLPTPSITMIHFDADMKLSAKSPGVLVQRGSQIYAKSEGNDSVTCTFKTCHDVQIWPLEIAAASVETRDNLSVHNLKFAFYLKLDFKWHGANDSPTPQKMRVYISGNNKLQNEVFSSLFMCNDSTFIVSDKQNIQNIGIQGIGITENESLFPYGNAIFKGFRLLQEYYAFPDKFLGFDIVLPEKFQICDTFTVLMPLKEYISLPKGNNTFLLHAVPAINLFDKITDSLRLTHQDLCYRLVADSYRNTSTEIMTIKKMMCVDQTSNEECKVDPFFSFSHKHLSKAPDLTWYAKRKKASVAGDDIYIYFADKNFSPSYPANKMFYAHALCSNRHMAELIPAFGLFSIERTLPVKQIYCLLRPTPQSNAICDGEAIWKLISMLSLNSLSFSDPTEFRKKLNEIVSVFAHKNTVNEVDNITNVAIRKTTKLHKSEAWKGFIRGTSIDITFDTSDSGMLFSYILSNMFSVYTSINTFTELTTINETGSKTWDMNTGLHNYL